MFMFLQAPTIGRPTQIGPFPWQIVSISSGSSSPCNPEQQTGCPRGEQGRNL